MVLAPHYCTVCGGWSKKDAATLCTCRKVCNKYDLTGAQSHHNDSSRWFAISSPLTHTCCPSFSFMDGVAKKK
jgi:hypothetical protein